MCACCNHCLPRTGYSKSSYDNKLVRLFWGRIPIEKGTAFFFYKAHSDTSRLLYQLKYGSHPEIGEHLGRIVAAEFVQDGFLMESQPWFLCHLLASVSEKEGIIKVWR